MRMDEGRKTKDEAQTAASGWGTPLNPPLLLYLVLTLVAFLVSPLPQQSLPYLVQTASGAALFLIAYRWLNGPARLRWLLWALVLGGGAVAAVGLFLVEWPAQYLLDLRPFLSHLPRLSATFSIHANAMAGVLLPLFCLAGGLWRLKLSGWQRALLIAALFFMGLMLLLTQSRNAWLALLAAWATYRLWGKTRFSFAAIGLGLLLVLPFVASLLPAAGLTHLEQGVTMLDDLTKSGETDEPSWLSRLEIWRVAGQTLADYPVLGAGLHTFEPVSRANYLYTVVEPAFNFTHAHNLFLQTAVNLGLVGLLLVAGLWGVVLWGLWQRQPQILLESGDWTAVLGAAFIALFWFNLFDLLVWEMKAGSFIWLLLAIAMRLSPARPLFETSYLISAAVGVWLILLLSPPGQANWRHLQLDQARFGRTAALSRPPADFAHDARRLGLAHRERGEIETAVSVWQADEESVSFLRQQGMITYLAGEWETAVGWYNLALQIEETDGLTHYWLGLAYQYQGDNPVQALVHYDRALADLLDDGSPSLLADVWEDRGRVLAQMTEWEAAADSFAQAVALFPDNPDYLQQLNQVNQLLQEKE
jgi:putative inorganic carbon (hco3(-)) transporter